MRELRAVAQAASRESIGLDLAGVTPVSRLKLASAVSPRLLFLLIASPFRKHVSDFFEFH
ncbi:hypothetical protein HispidOSU_014242 [Sigmodon hispidus]